MVGARGRLHSRRSHGGPGRCPGMARRQRACGPIWSRAVPARAEEQHKVIWDKAQELGRQIGQSAEYQALRRAETLLREDKETVAKLDQIQTLARQVDQMVATGQ